MRTTRSRALGLAVGVLLSSLLATAAAAADRRYGLQLGQPRALDDGTVAVPVRLRTPKGIQVAALNFTLRWDARKLVVDPRGVVAGTAVRRANATLASHVDAAMGTVMVLVVPAFQAEFGALAGSQLATVYLRPSGGKPAKRRRWVQRHLLLRDVVLGDAQGHELHLRAAGRKS